MGVCDDCIFACGELIYQQRNLRGAGASSGSSSSGGSTGYYLPNGAGWVDQFGKFHPRLGFLHHISLLVSSSDLTFYALLDCQRIFTWPALGCLYLLTLRMLYRPCIYTCTTLYKPVYSLYMVATVLGVVVVKRDGGTTNGRPLRPGGGREPGSSGRRPSRPPLRRSVRWQTCFIAKSKLFDVHVVVFMLGCWLAAVYMHVLYFTVEHVGHLSDGRANLVQSWQAEDACIISNLTPQRRIMYHVNT